MLATSMVFSLWMAFIYLLLKTPLCQRKEEIRMGRLDKELIRDQKYHFRYYRPSQNHPFLVALVKENIGDDGKVYLSGFNITHSFMMFYKNPNDYIKIQNPNPNDDADCFVQKAGIKDKPLKLFSSPIKGWSLSEEDEKLIDELVKEKLL